MMAWDEFVLTQGGVAAEELFTGLWRLTEPALVPACRSCFYALETPDALVLIDGGWGLVRSVRDLPMAKGRPLVAIASHSHSDHIGALHLADTRYAHKAEAHVLADPDPYATQARPWIDDLAFAADGTAVAPESYRQFACAPTHLVEDGDVLDFGPVALHVLWTPGHSPGSISLLEPQKGWLFCADTIHDGHIYDDIPGADPQALHLSHSRLLDTHFHHAFPGHGGVMSFMDASRRVADYRQQRNGQHDE